MDVLPPTGTRIRAGNLKGGERQMGGIKDSGVREWLEFFHETQASRLDSRSEKVN
jgi:hypothetical protein